MRIIILLLYHLFFLLSWYPSLPLWPSDLQQFHRYYEYQTIFFSTSIHTWKITFLSSWVLFMNPFVLTCWKMIQPVATMAVLQPAKAATLCWNSPTSPYPTFFASTKLIFKTDCTNLYTAKVRQHQKASSVIKGLNMWSTVCKFPTPYIEQLQLLRYSKFQIAKAFLWLQTMDKCKVHAWSTNECAIYTMQTGKFTYTKVKHNAKLKALFCFLVMWPVRLIASCWPVYHFQPLKQLWLLQYSKLQMAKTVIK